MAPIRALLLALWLAAAPAALGVAPRVAPAPPGWETLRSASVTVHVPPGARPMAGDLLGAAPPLLDAIRTEIGLPLPGEGVTVYLVTGADAQRAVDAALGPAPEWAAGYALRGRPILVLRTSTRSGPLVADLPAVFRHELVHVVVDRFLGDRAGVVPLWFHEGVATVLAHEGRLTEWSTLARQALFGSELRLATLDRVLSNDASPPDSIRAAYVEAYAFTADCIRRHGPGVIGEVLRGVRGGSSFEESFRAATGVGLAEAEARFLRSFRWRYRWLPILTSSLTLWLAITALVLWVGIVKRRRAAERLAEMRAEDPWWDRDEPGGYVH